MTNQQSESEPFDWGPLGEAWWREAGKSVGASELQLRFASVKHRGSSNTAAMKTSGSTASADTIRQTAYRTFRSNAVQSLLALAKAEAGGGTDGTVDGAEAKRILSGMARGADPNVKIRAVEALMKLEDRSAELGRVPDDDGFADWRWVRDMLRMPHGGPAAAHLHFGATMWIGNAPLLHDLVADVVRDDPDLWLRLCNGSGSVSAASRVDLISKLGNLDWQREARAKLWLEVGVDVEARDEQNQEFLAIALAMLTGGGTTQAAARTIEGHSMNGSESVGART